MRDYKREVLNFEGYAIYMLFYLITIIPAFALSNTIAGDLYFKLILLSSVFFFTIFFGYIASGRFQKRDEFTNFEFAFPKTIHASFFYYYLGILSAPLYALIVSLVVSLFHINLPQSYEIVRPFYIYSSSSISQLAGQNYNIVITSLNDFYNTYLTVVIAGVQETHIFNYISVLGLLLVAFVVRKMLFLKNNPTFDRRFDMIFAIIGSVIVVMIAHGYNQTYINAPFLFILAGIFFLSANISIYWFGVSLVYFIGFHESNNCASIGYGKCIYDLFFSSTNLYIQIPLIILFFGGLLYTIVVFIRDPRQFIKDIKLNVGL